MKCSVKHIFFIIIFSGSLAAQENNLKFEHFSIEHGLSQTTVHFIIQDKQGFLWFCTEDGLNRFDGYHFVVYRNDRKDNTSLASNSVRTILQDRNQLIWVGTNNGLSVQTLIKDSTSGKKREGFINFFNDPNDSSSLSHNEVRCLFQDKSGDIWIGTAKGLNKLLISPGNNPGENLNGRIKFLRFYDNLNSKESISNSIISAITEDLNGNLYIGTMGAGLKVLDKQTGRTTGFKNDPTDQKSLGSNYVIKLFSDRIGRIWIGTYNGGLNLFDYKTGRFIRYQHDVSNPYSISDNRVYGMTDDLQGSLWLGTFGGGINKFEISSGRFTNYKNSKQNDFSLSNDFVRSVLIDRSNNLWAATNYGVNKADLKLPKFNVLKNNSHDQTSLSDNYVLSILEDNSGTLWVGTNNGLDKYNPEKNSFINYKIPHNNPKSADGFVYSIVQDNAGIIWLGTVGGGLIRFDPKEKITNYFQHNPNDRTTISDNRINTHYLDSNGEILVGTVSGICRFNIKTGRFKHYIVSAQDSLLLFRKSINTILKDRNNTYWVGTTSGLVSINSEGGDCRVFINEKDKHNSVSSSYIITLVEDGFGNLWVGTDQGLNLLNKNENTFTLFSTSEGLPNNYISAIVVDNDGNLWITTNRGISKFNPRLPDTKKFRNYDASDGLQGLEFNPGAWFKNKNGEIYFGGTNGLNKFNPSNISDNPNPPDVVITSFNKFGKPELSANHLSNMDQIELSFDESYFSFEFSALDFTDPHKNQYAYMLEGFDEDWINIGSRRFANYTNIDPGNYKFRVKASNNDGVWNEEGASIKLIIHPPFYRTLSAYILYVVLIAVGLYSVRRYELRKRKEKNEALLKDEREKAKLREAQLRAEKAELQSKALESEQELEKQKIRYRIASDLHDEIGSNLSSITLLCSLIGRNIKPDEEINNQLSDISNAAKSSAESIRDIVWFLNPTSDILSRLLARMKETANLLLRNINYNIETAGIDSDLRINPDVKRNVYLIFKEALNNISKHSQAGKVKIRIVNENHNFSLLIIDDGIGFELDSVPEGNGLRNLNNRAEQIGAELKIISSPGKGTTISLKADIA